mgnify:CR=1 FL=1
MCGTFKRVRQQFFIQSSSFNPFVQDHFRKKYIYIYWMHVCCLLHRVVNVDRHFVNWSSQPLSMESDNITLWIEIWWLSQCKKFNFPVTQKGNRLQLHCRLAPTDDHILSGAAASNGGSYPDQAVHDRARLLKFAAILAFLYPHVIGLLPLSLLDLVSMVCTCILGSRLDSNVSLIILVLWAVV